MRKLMVVLVVAGLLFGTTSARGTPAVTDINGDVNSSLTIIGTGFGNAPTWAFFETFEGVSRWPSEIDTTSAGNATAEYIYGSGADALYWQSHNMTTAGLYPWKVSGPVIAKSGVNSAWKDARKGVFANLSLASATGVADATPPTSVFVSAWFYDEADTGSYNTLTTTARSLITLSGVGATDSNVVAGYYDPATNPDSSLTRYGTRQGLTRRGWNLKNQNYRKAELLANQWNRIDLYAKQHASAGKLWTWMNYCLVDSTATATLGAGGAGWNKILFSSRWVSADSFTTARTYWDNIYIASSPQRVEFGDKIYYGNCTKRYIQPFTAWAATSITITPNFGDITKTSKFYVFISDHLNDGISMDTDTAIDSVTVVVPSITSSVDSTTTKGTSYTFTYDNDSDDDISGTDPGYNAVVGNYTINWGDGTPTDETISTSATHTYKAAGFYLVSVSAANAKGTGTGKMWLRVYDAAGSAGSFPNRNMWLDSAVQSGKKDAGYAASIFQFSAREHEMKVALYGYDATSGRWYRVRPPVSVTGADSVLTVPRGQPLAVDLNGETARAFTYWSPDGIASSLWAGWK